MAGQNPCHHIQRVLLMKLLHVSLMAAVALSAATQSFAAVEQCRFINSKPDREACYDRQAKALAAKKAEAAVKPKTAAPERAKRWKTRRCHAGSRASAAAAKRSPKIEWSAAVRGVFAVPAPLRSAPACAEMAALKTSAVRQPFSSGVMSAHSGGRPCVPLFRGARRALPCLSDCLARPRPGHLAIAQCHHHSAVHRRRHCRPIRAAAGQPYAADVRPILCRRKSRRGGRQYRRGSGRQGAERWLHAAARHRQHPSINPTLHLNLAFFDAARDFQPVSLIARLPNMLVVKNSMPVKNCRGSVPMCKANPDKLNYGFVRRRHLDPPGGGVVQDRDRHQR